MNRGLELPETDRIRVLAVGSSWLRSATVALEDGEITIRGPFESGGTLGESLDETDCVLTDDRDVLATIDGECPVVFAVDEADREAIDSLPVGGLDERNPSDASGAIGVADAADAAGAVEPTRPETATETIETIEATELILRSAAETPAVLAHRLRQTARLAGLRRTVSRRERWYRALLEQSSELLVVADADGTIDYVSPSVERIGGYDAETLVGNHLLENVHPEDAPTIRAAFEDLRASDPGTQTSIEYRCQHANDAWYIHEAVLTNRLADDVVGGIVASIRDVTEHHHVERELDESFKRVSDAFYALDSEWRFTYVTEQAADILEAEPDDLLGQHIVDCFPELEGTAFQQAALDAMRSQEATSLERYLEATGCWYDVHIYPSPSGISVYFQDVTERVERERELRERTERLETLVQNVPVVLFVLDADGTFTLVEGSALEDVNGLSDDVVGESVFDVFADDAAILADAQAALDGKRTHSSIRLGEHVFEACCQPITTEGAVDHVIGIATDVTERVQYQETLNTLHEATSHLLTVESMQDACEYIVDVAADVLDIDSVVYRFDDQQNELVPAAYSQHLESIVGRPPRLQPDQGITWRTFVTGSASCFDDVRDSDRVYDPSTTIRSGLYVPIGEHGVLVGLSPERGEFDDDTFELAQLFAATAEAALDRINHTRRLHGREWELEQQNLHLEQLNAANQVRQDIEQLLLMADSRSEIERGVCDRLADLEDCSFAWIGEPDPSGNQLHVKASGGRDQGYLETVTATTVDNSAAEPAGRSARTRGPVHVENVADPIRDGTWRVEALSRSVQSVYAVPLVYDGFLYGVLAVYGNGRDVFDESLRATLAELGEAVAYTIDAVKRKAALRSDGLATVELELELGGESPLCRLAEHLNSRVEFEGVTSSDDSPTVFVATDAADVADREDELAALEGIHDAVVIAEGDDEALLQLRCTEPSLGAVVDANGGTLETFVADPSGSRATVAVPETVEIRDVLSGLNRRGFSASMVARREQTTDDLATIDASARNALLERLTDRQREVVQTAYHSGFFEWPRRATGESIADSLEISPPAFHKHVRAAERKLFTSLFDGSTRG